MSNVHQILKYMTLAAFILRYSYINIKREHSEGYFLAIYKSVNYAEFMELLSPIHEKSFKNGRQVA